MSVKPLLIALALGISPISVASAQDTGKTDVAATDARAWLTREIARLEQDIADLARFGAWQDRLIRAARSNPAEAFIQRRPMAECQASVLAPICDEFWALFQPAPDTGADDAAGQPDQPDGEKAP